MHTKFHGLMLRARRWLTTFLCSFSEFGFSTPSAVPASISLFANTDHPGGDWPFASPTLFLQTRMLSDDKHPIPQREALTCMVCTERLVVDRSLI